MNPADCCNQCPTPTTVNVPGIEGEPGDPCVPCSDGVNAFTQTTADFTVPAVLANVTISVANSTWMGIGQTIFIVDAGAFQVVSKGSTTSVTLTYLNYDINTNTGNSIPTGNLVSPSGTQITSIIQVNQGGTGDITATLARASLGVGGDNLSVYASGTAYQLTNTAALLNFGTTDPSLTITSAGVWLILSRVRVDYTGATFAAVRTGALKLRRTNNTAADIVNSPCGFLTDIITTLTYTLGSFTLPPIIYTTTNSNDVIEIWGSISVVPTAGSLDASEAHIVAIKLFDQTV